MKGPDVMSKSERTQRRYRSSFVGQTYLDDHWEDEPIHVSWSKRVTVARRNDLSMDAGLNSDTEFIEDGYGECTDSCSAVGKVSIVICAKLLKH